MLPRLASNPWAQAILMPQLPLISIISTKTHSPSDLKKYKINLCCFMTKILFVSANTVFQIMACLSESWYVSLARSFVISIYLMMAVSHEVMNELSDLCGSALQDIRFKNCFWYSWPQMSLTNKKNLKHQILHIPDTYQHSGIQSIRDLEVCEYVSELTWSM